MTPDEHQRNAPLIPRPHQRSLERPPLDFLAGEVHAGDAACVADIVERIGVEHQKVGALAERLVAATMTWAGVMPASAIIWSSFCSAKPKGWSSRPVSPPRMIPAPAAASFATL